MACFSVTFTPAIIFTRAAVLVDTAQHVLAMGILSVCPYVLVSRPGTESSPGELETPGFHHMVA